MGTGGAQAGAGSEGVLLAGGAQRQRGGAGRDRGSGGGGRICPLCHPSCCPPSLRSAQLPRTPRDMGMLWGCPEPGALAPTDTAVPPQVGDAEPELGAADSWIGVVPVGEEPAEVPRGAKEESFTAAVVSKVTFQPARGPLCLARGLPRHLVVMSPQGIFWGVSLPDGGSPGLCLVVERVPDRTPGQCQPLLALWRYFSQGKEAPGAACSLAMGRELNDGTARLPVLLPVLPSEPVSSVSADEASPGAGGISPAHPGAEPKRHPGGRRIPEAGP